MENGFLSSLLNLFSSFDVFFFSSQSIVAYLIILISTSSFCLSGSTKSLILSLNFFLLKFFNSLYPLRASEFSLVIFSFLFFLMGFLNIFSIFPYNFPVTSQPSVVLYIGFSLWMTFIFFSFIKGFKGSVLHFIPEGAPSLLAPFLFVIELVSNIIRPVTLSVRMVANILAGHLLMILLSHLVFSFPLSFLFYLILNIVEVFVGLIQSYIFVTMLCLYFSDSK